MDNLIMFFLHALCIVFWIWVIRRFFGNIFDEYKQRSNESRRKIQIQNEIFEMNKKNKSERLKKEKEEYEDKRRLEQIEEQKLKEKEKIIRDLVWQQLECKYSDYEIKNMDAVWLDGCEYTYLDFEMSEIRNKIIKDNKLIL